MCQNHSFILLSIFWVDLDNGFAKCLTVQKISIEKFWPKIWILDWSNKPTKWVLVFVKSTGMYYHHFLYGRFGFFFFGLPQTSFSKWATNKLLKLGAWWCCSNSYFFNCLDKSTNFRLTSAQTSGRFFFRKIFISPNEPPSDFMRGPCRSCLQWL